MGVVAVEALTGKVGGLVAAGVGVPSDGEELLVGSVHWNDVGGVPVDRWRSIRVPRAPVENSSTNQTRGLSALLPDRRLSLDWSARGPAFEVESTTSIYSGLLRMADLLSMQPNLNIPLYLVAPDERRQKVFTEVNRPTFSRLSPPLVDVCRYVAFSTLRDQLAQVRSFIRYLKSQFLDELSEPCVIGDD